MNQACTSCGVEVSGVPWACPACGWNESKEVAWGKGADNGTPIEEVLEVDREIVGEVGGRIAIFEGHRQLKGLRITTNEGLPPDHISVDTGDRWVIIRVPKDLGNE